MKIAIEKECAGHRYSAEEDENRDGWSVTTDYINGKIYLDPPDDEAGTDVHEAYARAITKACQDMKRDVKSNRTGI